MNKLKIILALLVVSILVLPACDNPEDPWRDPAYYTDITVQNEFVVEGKSTFGGDAFFKDDVDVEGLFTAEDLLVNNTSTFTGLSQFNDTTTFADNITLDGDGLVWIEFRLDLDWSTVQAHGKPDHVTRGLFDGFSLPIYGADDEELYFEVCVPDRWMGPAWTLLSAIGDKPGGMAVYQGKLYIPCEGDDNVFVYDGETLSISGNVGDIPVYSYTYKDMVYVTCYGDDTVWVFDGTTWSISGVVGNGPMGMVSDGVDLYVACLLGDEIWRLSGGVWTVDPALGAGGVAGAVGTDPLFMAYYEGEVYVGCGGTDDDVWIRSGGVWAKEDDVGGNPQEFQAHAGDLFLNCYTDDSIWRRSGGVWAIATNILTTQGNAPIGLTEYDGNLYSACMDSVWSDYHTVDANVVPFWNNNSDFTISGGDEPMYLTEYDGKLYCACNANDTIWVYSGETCITSIHVWITDAQANATDALRLNVDFNSFTPDVDIVPAGEDGAVREILTGPAVQNQSYGLHMPLDLTGVGGDDSMSIRIRRIASSDEIVGEVVIQHVGIIFKCNKLGSPEP